MATKRCLLCGNPFAEATNRCRVGVEFSFNGQEFTRSHRTIVLAPYPKIRRISPSTVSVNLASLGERGARPSNRG